VPVWRRGAGGGGGGGGHLPLLPLLPPELALRVSLDSSTGRQDVRLAQRH